MRIGDHKLISPPGARSTTGGARSMSYHKGIILRVHMYWKYVKKSSVNYKLHLKIALCVLVLFPCMSSIVPVIEETRQELSDIQQTENNHAQLSHTAPFLLNDLSDTNIPGDVSQDKYEPILHKPTEELPGTPEPPPAETISTYEVVSGDTLEGIARRHNTVTSYLLQINEIENPGALSIGQIINVPTPAAGAPTPRPEPVQDPTIATAADIEALAQMIHCEAHWESYNGLIAVGQCAYDRWKNTRRVEGQPYVWNPDGEMTLTEILTTNGQFALADMTTLCETCHQAARDVVSGVRAFKDHIVTNFRVHESVDDWNSLPYIGHIGGHAFYGYAR